MPQTKNAKRRKAIAMREREIVAAVGKTYTANERQYDNAMQDIADKELEIERIQANIAKTPETKR